MHIHLSITILEIILMKLWPFSSILCKKIEIHYPSTTCCPHFSVSFCLPMRGRLSFHTPSLHHPLKTFVFSTGENVSYEVTCKTSSNRGNHTSNARFNLRFCLYSDKLSRVKMSTENLSTWNKFAASVVMWKKGTDCLLNMGWHLPGWRRALGLTLKLWTFCLGVTPHFIKCPNSALSIYQ